MNNIRIDLKRFMDIWKEGGRRGMWKNKIIVRGIYGMKKKEEWM